MWRSPRCARQRITIGSAKPVDDSTCLTKCRIGGAAHRTITRLRQMGRYQKRNFGTTRDTLSAFHLLDLIRGMPVEPCRSLVAAHEADAVIGRDRRCRCRRGVEPAEFDARGFHQTSARWSAGDVGSRCRASPSCPFERSRRVGLFTQKIGCSLQGNFWGSSGLS